MTDFLNITSRVRDSGYEQGLLAFALSPDYASSGRVFAYYTDNAGNLQLDEYTRAAGEGGRVEADTRRPLLTIRHQRSHSHNGGQLLFGPDGYLYLSTGDGDLEGDPDGDAQDLGSLLGKILRLDVGVATPAPPDTTAPALEMRVKRRQKLRPRGGAVAYARCPESCSAAARGRLRIAGRLHRMRRATTVAGPGRASRVELLLRASGRRALERGLHRRPADLRSAHSAGPGFLRQPLTARDTHGETQPYHYPMRAHLRAGLDGPSRTIIVKPQEEPAPTPSREALEPEPEPVPGPEREREKVPAG